MFDEILNLGTRFYFYQAAIVVCVIGLYVVISSGNLFKKLVGLSLFQGAVFMHLILLAYVRDGAPPILREVAPAAGFVNPLPHVLVLTAIVVAVATLALALALIVRIYDERGVVDEDEILEERRPR